MKKFIALVLASVLIISAFASCGDVENTTSTTLSASDIIGSWAYVTENEKNVITFNEDGTVLNQAYVFGCYSKESTGTYTDDGTNTSIALKGDEDLNASYSFDGYNNLVLVINGENYVYNKTKPFTTDQYKEENGYYTGLWADVPTPVAMFTDSHFADVSTAYNYEITESAAEKTTYGVNYNYFFADEATAQEAFSKYYTYLLEDKFSLPKDSDSLEEKIKKLNLNRNVKKESEFEISRNIFVNDYTGEEIGIGLCYDENEKRVVLSVTLFNDDYDPDDYAADRTIKINYNYKGVVVTKHRSNINPANYHVVSTVVVKNGNNGNNNNNTNTENQNNNTNTSSTDNTSSQDANTAIGENVKVTIPKPELSAAFLAEVGAIQKSESLTDHTYTGTGDTHVIRVDNVPEYLSVSMGAKDETLTAAAVVPSADVDTGIMWTSENEEIAAIDKNGVIYGIAPGIVKIVGTPYDTKNGITRECYVIVYSNAGDDEESAKLLELINNERSNNGLGKLSATITNVNAPQDTDKVKYVANERAYEEAYENDGIMDNTRPNGSEHATIFDKTGGYDLWNRGNATYYVWGENYDAATVFEKLKGASDVTTTTTYTYAYAGLYKDAASNVSFWAITLVKIA